MNTDSMTRFLAQVSTAHNDEFIVMVLDGASSHKSKELKIPDNVSLIPLPPYSPELNPAEQIWNLLRRDYFANRVFDSLDAATKQAERGLADDPFERRDELFFGDLVRLNHYLAELDAARGLRDYEVSFS